MSRSSSYIQSCIPQEAIYIYIYLRVCLLKEWFDTQQTLTFPAAIEGGFIQAIGILVSTVLFDRQQAASRTWCSYVIHNEMTIERLKPFEWSDRKPVMTCSQMAQMSWKPSMGWPFVTAVTRSCCPVYIRFSSLFLSKTVILKSIYVCYFWEGEGSDMTKNP